MISRTTTRNIFAWLLLASAVLSQTPVPLIIVLVVGAVATIGLLLALAAVRAVLLLLLPAWLLIIGIYLHLPLTANLPLFVRLMSVCLVLGGLFSVGVGLIIVWRTTQKTNSV